SDQDSSQDGPEASQHQKEQNLKHGGQNLRERRNSLTMSSIHIFAGSDAFDGPAPLEVLRSLRFFSSVPSVFQVLLLYPGASRSELREGQFQQRLLLQVVRRMR